MNVMRELGRRFRQSRPGIEFTSKVKQMKPGSILRSSDGRKYLVMGNGEWRRIGK